MLHVFVQRRVVNHNVIEVYHNKLVEIAMDLFIKKSWIVYQPYLNRAEGHNKELKCPIESDTGGLVLIPFRYLHLIVAQTQAKLVK